MNKLTTCFSFLSTLILTNSVTAQPAALHFGTPLSANVSAARLQRIDKILQQSIDSSWIKGAVGFIARNGVIVYDKAFGFSDATNNTQMTPDAIFRIASQTKAITSVAVMMLFEEGKLLLDDPISKYIPPFARPQVLDQLNDRDSTYTTIPAKREVTIRDLLTHTSGIDYAAIGTPKMKAIYAKANIASGLGDAKLDLEEEINRLGKLPLAHQPGERFTYGLNTDVLGRLVEILSGMTLDRFFQERIFKPLGMNDTYFYLPASKYSRLASVYTLGPQQNLVKQERGNINYPKTNATFYSGGAGLSATIGDYAIFLQMLLNGGTYKGQRILSRRTIELMTTNQIGDLNVGLDKFGLGFQLTSEKGFAKLGVSRGSFSWGGYYGTTYWADPEKKLVCLLFIQQTPLRGEIQDKFRALVYQALED